MIVLLLLFVIVYICAHYIYKINTKQRKYPPGPISIPFIGSTYQLRKEAKRLGGQHLVFEKWAVDYKSPVIAMKLGKENFIVVHSYKYVKEVHSNSAFEGRPDTYFLRLRTMGTRKGITCTDGPLWSEHRHFSIRHLRQIGYGRGPMELYICQQSEELLSYISSHKNTPIWPGSFLSHNIISVLWKLIAGNTINRDNNTLNRLLCLLQKRSKVFDMSGGILSQMPWLRFIAPESTGYAMICKLNEELYSFFKSVIDDHKQKYNEELRESDFIYAFLNEMGAKGQNSTFTESQLVMTILDYFIAGSQSTSTTLDLAFMMMIIRNDIQEKIITEINEHYNYKDNTSTYRKDLLPYTLSFLMEVQRFFHITPITGPRRAVKDTMLGEFYIPKNTSVLIGMRSVLMDKDHWTDPDVFRPERFLTTNNLVENDEYFIPFGQGKRRCLGDALARSCIFTFFVHILKHYKLQAHCEKDMPSTTLLPGLILSPKPYNVIFSDRC